MRNSPEKLLVLRFPQLTPPTAIARDLATIRAFKARHGDIILKPLYGNGGAGVFRLDENDRNHSSLYELFTSMSREPMIVQKVPAGGIEGRQAGDPGRWRTRRRHQPVPQAARRVEHACRRPPEKMA